jgi:hypothetical protein
LPLVSMADFSTMPASTRSLTASGLVVRSIAKLGQLDRVLGDSPELFRGPSQV